MVRQTQTEFVARDPTSVIFAAKLGRRENIPSGMTGFIFAGEKLALFLSTYTNKVDKKGRVSVPANFRATLSDQKFQGIIIYTSFVNECVEACGMDRVERLSESIDDLDPYSDERDAFAATILGGSVQLSFDGEGRVMLPEKVMEEAGISDKAVFVGKGATFEIWEPKAFEVYSEKAREIAKRERASLRLNKKGD